MNLPPEQEAIRAKCFHPSREFAEFPKDDVGKSVPQRLAKIVRMYPNNIAFRYLNQSATYAALDAKANGIAHWLLKQQGIAAEPIPLMLQKGLDRLACILAVLKAGKFFVLMEPESPIGRNAEIIEELQPRVFLTDDRYFDDANQIAGTHCKPRPYASADIGPVAESPGIAIDCTALAFIRYTSGSTGRPKGVCAAHRNLLHQIYLYTNTYKISPADRLSVLTSSTGNTITMIFSALLNGACQLPFDVKTQGVKKLSHWLRTERITFSMLSSPLFRNLCESLTGHEKHPDLRVIRLASEGAYSVDAELFKEHFPTSCVLANALSSGETNLMTTFFVDHKLKIASGNLPVGYSVDDKDIMIRDEQGCDAGYDQIGEIVVRSAYLSPGYWKRPDLTQAKFKADPSDPSKRIYLTGDLGLMRPDGCVVHQGRKDFRVKIRGYGVDLVEVENAMICHPCVRDAAVVAQRNEDGSHRLVSYFVCAPRAAVTIGEIRNHLKDTLADYMIPSRFMRLDKLPLTSNGKIDRHALPLPDNKRPELSAVFVSPRNEVEEQLVQIWQELLDVSPIGVHDDFFELGGHSLAASRVVSRVLREFRLEIPLRSLFMSPTIADMAAIVVAHLDEKLYEQSFNRILNELESLTEDEAKKLVGELKSEDFKH